MKETKEPKHRDDILGKYRLLNGSVLIITVSFDTKKDAEVWGRWNNFGQPNPFEIVTNPNL